MEKISIKSFGLYLMSALISCLLIATVVTMCSSCVDNVEWKEICDEYEFVILYKDKTNILITIDKD